MSPALAGAATADLAVVGGGYTGLWTALLAKERDPDRDVRARRGPHRRLGGVRAQRRVLRGQPDPRAAQRPGPLPGRDGRPSSGSAGRTSTASRRPWSAHGIDCSFERTGELTVATAPWQADDLRELPAARRAASAAGSSGWTPTRCAPRSTRRPTSAGVLDRDGVAMVDPARLAWGLRAACLRLGVRIHENTPVTALERSGAGVRAANGVRPGDRAPGRARHQRVPGRCCAGCRPTSCRSGTTRW